MLGPKTQLMQFILISCRSSLYSYSPAMTIIVHPNIKNENPRLSLQRKDWRTQKLSGYKEQQIHNLINWERHPIKQQAISWQEKTTAQRYMRFYKRCSEEAMRK